MKKIIFLFALFSLSLLMSCDKVKSPYSEISTNNGGDRKILIEDFTGHKCVNCPRAAETIKSLQQLRPGKIISIGVHVTNQFAAPGSGIYNIDFRTPTGNSLDSMFKVGALGLPSGMVNRILVNGIYRIEYPKWGEYAETMLNIPAEVYITINNSYDSVSRTVSSTIKSDFRKENTRVYKLTAYVIEDSIIHAQKDNLILPPSNDSNYVHQHVLRGSLNGPFGEVLTSAPVDSNSTFTRIYSRTLNAA